VIKLDQQTIDEVTEIRKLLAEAYTKALFYDGYAKSSEGAVSIFMHPWFWEQSYGFDDDDSHTATGELRPRVSVYSYVFSEDGERCHEYPSSTEALEAVRRWHAEEMAREYCARCKGAIDREQCSCDLDE